MGAHTEVLELLELWLPEASPAVTALFCKAHMFLQLVRRAIPLAADPHLRADLPACGRLRWVHRLAAVCARRRDQPGGALGAPVAVAVPP